MRARVRTAGVLLLVAVAAGSGALLLPPAPVAEGSVSSHGSPSAEDWPELHEDASLTGVAPDSTISTANAGSLGVAWMRQLYAPALDSTVVAYDATVGEDLAYVGNEAGDLEAVSLGSGQILWGDDLSSAIRSTPIVDGSSVFAATTSPPELYKLDASTGAVECSLRAPLQFESTPVIATPPGGTETLFIGENDTAAANGPVIAVDTSDCSIEWSFDDYANPAGVWDSLSYAVDGAGTPLVLFGTADPDAGVYALNALTGAEVWRYQSYNPAPGTYDIGAGVAVSPPGTNGFADGVAYVPSKEGMFYALDLATGALIWSTRLFTPNSTSDGGRSTAALAGTTLVVGTDDGVAALDALTGAVLWTRTDSTKTEVLASPAVMGPAGSQVVAVADLGGAVEVLSLATGTVLYQYQTGGYVAASPAVSGGNLLVDSSDGYLYDFAAGGGAEAGSPAVAVTSPTTGADLPAPPGDLLLTGTATDPNGVSRVELAVQEDGNSGPWWDGATGALSNGPVDDLATLSSPGATTTGWSYELPVPVAGGSFELYATAVASTGVASASPALVDFTVSSAAGGPSLSAQAFVHVGARLSFSGSGFAPGETVTASLAGATTSLVASSSGTIGPGSLAVPLSAPFGPTALVADGASGDGASATVVVANSWDEAGEGPGNSGYEPNDRSLFDLVHVAPNEFLDGVYDAVTGAPAVGSPAVADEVAYVANTAGQLTAVSATTGEVLWTWSDPSGSPLTGSPTLDPSAGLALVGTESGTLVAVRLSTGRTEWTRTFSGAVLPPALEAGTAYLTVAPHHLVAIDLSHRSTVWSVRIAARGTATPPVVDPDGATVVVGLSTGAVVALSSTTGGVLWSTDLAGPVTATPTIGSGTVYAATTSGEVASLAEPTGAIGWTTTLGAGVDASGVLTDKGTASGQLDYVVGTTAGSVVVLEAATGTLGFSVSLGSSAVVGLAACLGVVVATEADGWVGATRAQTNLVIWRSQVADAIAGGPAVVDGAVYVGGGDGDLHVYTPYGDAPK